MSKYIWILNLCLVLASSVSFVTFFITGCEECNNANPGVCLKHGPLYPIVNRPVMSKARASLPLILYIDHFQGGVFSKRRIPKRTQFGPVEGPLMPQGELQDTHFQLKVYDVLFKWHCQHTVFLFKVIMLA